jgi:hypothetical protein
MRTMTFTCGTCLRDASPRSLVYCLAPAHETWHLELLMPWWRDPEYAKALEALMPPWRDPEWMYWIPEAPDLDLHLRDAKVYVAERACWVAGHLLSQIFVAVCDPCRTWQTEGYDAHCDHYDIERGDLPPEDWRQHVSWLRYRQAVGL